MSAVRVDPTTAHRDLTRSALTTGEPSWPTRDVLVERGLAEAYRERPEAALADLHRAMLSSQDPDVLFALSELSFLYTQKTAKAEYQLAAAVYAYAFLFPEEIDLRPGPFDPRFRMAAAATAANDRLAPRLRVPLTALLRIEHPRRALAAQAPLHATLELHLS